MKSSSRNNGLSPSCSPSISSSDSPSCSSISSAVTETERSLSKLKIAESGICGGGEAANSSTFDRGNFSLQLAQDGSMSERSSSHIPAAKTSIEQSIGSRTESSPTRSPQASILNLHDAARIGFSNNSQTIFRPKLRRHCRLCHQSNSMIPNPSMRVQGHRHCGNSSAPLGDYSISGAISGHGIVNEEVYRRTGSAYHYSLDHPVDNPEMETVCYNPNTLVDLSYLKHSRNSVSQGHFSPRNCALGWEGNHFGDSRIGKIMGSDYSQSPISSLDILRITARPMSVDVPWANIVKMAATNYTGSSNLQRVLDTGEPIAIKRIFDGVLECVFELMTNQFGICLLQKLITVCSDDQIAELVHRVTSKEDRLICLGCHEQGTVFLQKLISTIKRSSQLVESMMSAITPGLLILMKDKNGSQMIDKCLFHFSEHNQVISKIIVQHCIELAKDAIAYLRIQHCVRSFTDPYRQVLLIKIVNEALQLAQDVYGNFVVQEVIGLQMPELTKAICRVLRGHFVKLSMNKYGSHVVEKCIKSPEINIVVTEFVRYGRLGDVACDYFGNYVLQTALRTAKGNLCYSLVRALQEHYSRLQVDIHGQNVLREWANAEALLQFQKDI